MLDWLWKKKKAPGIKAELIMTDPAQHPVARFQNEMNSLFERFWSDWGNWPALPQDPFPSQRGWALDVDDQPDQYVVRAEAPGFDPNDLDVQVSGNLLTIKAEHKEEKKEKQSSRYSYGSLQRSFTLPQGIDSDQINAQYKNGVLELYLPKSEEARAKRIAVTG